MELVPVRQVNAAIPRTSAEQASAQNPAFRLMEHVVLLIAVSAPTLANPASVSRSAISTVEMLVLLVAQLAVRPPPIAKQLHQLLLRLVFEPETVSLCASYRNKVFS